MPSAPPEFRTILGIPFFLGSVDAAVERMQSGGLLAAVSYTHLIRGIPALLIFSGGKVAEQIVGYVPKDTIDKTINKVLV